MSVQLADEDDQTPTNFAVITEVIVNTSAIVVRTGGATLISLQQQVNVCIMVLILAIAQFGTQDHNFDNSSNSWLVRNCV